MANVAEIPVVDFSAYSLDRESADPDEFQKLISDVHNAFTTIGFTYLKNHGISKTSIENVFKHSKTFFELPVEVKRKYARPSDFSSNHGYVGIEVETLNPAERPGDYKEAFNCMRLNDKVQDDVPEFLTSLHELCDKCTELTNRLLEVMGRGLNLEDPMLFVKANKLAGQPENDTTMRSLYYPPIGDDVVLKPNQIRCGEHSDYGSLTLLFQDNGGGLEVKTKDGDFISATPIEGTVLVNIGDLMQRWTTDKLVSNVHRVIIPESENRQSTRQSIAYFSHPDTNSVVKCIDGSDKYPPITGGDYLRQRFEVTY